MTMYAFLEYLPVGCLVIDRPTDTLLYANQLLLDKLPQFANFISQSWGNLVDEKNVARISEDVDMQLSLSDYFQLNVSLAFELFGDKRLLTKGKLITTADNQEHLLIYIENIITDNRLANSTNEHLVDMEALNEALPGGILIAKNDENFSIIYANRGYYALTGFSKEETLELFNNHTSDMLYRNDNHIIQERFHQQIENDNKFHIETQLKHKTKGFVWVSFDGYIFKGPSGTQRSYCMVVDITERIMMMDKLRKEQEHSRIILQLADDILFDYDIADRLLSFSGNVSERFHVPDKFYNFPESVLSRDIIPQHSLSDFMHIIENIHNGEEHNPPELQLRRYNGDLIWYQIQYKLIFGTNGQPLKAIGKMTDITVRRTMLDELTHKTQTDPLTKLFNKEETQLRIETCLQEATSDDRFALMMIDVDNFKAVNDSLGHQFGDAVLVEIATHIKSLFRETDILGRIGGDEFIVFLRNIKDKQLIIDKATKLSKAFRKTFTGGRKDYKISSSIGISLYPKHGNTFSALYNMADMALYESKHKGKDCFTIYNETIEQCLMSNSQPLEEAERFIASYFREDIVYNIFEMLYETKDLYTTINMVLAIIGKRYNVDRCYIFEHSEDGLICNNTYEWCNTNVTPQKNNPQNINVPVTVMQYMFSLYSDDGIFYCNDISTLDELTFNILHRQGIKSLLHCALLDNHVIKGFIGFDDCTQNRSWRGDEIAMITYIAKILSIFLIKKRHTDSN